MQEQLHAKFSVDSPKPLSSLRRYSMHLGHTHIHCARLLYLPRVTEPYGRVSDDSATRIQD